MVGFWTPDFMHSVTVPDYHLHFISKDKQRGGHLIEFLSKNIEIKIQPIEQLTLDLPHSIEYLSASLDDDISVDLAKAEH